MAPSRFFAIFSRDSEQLLEMAGMLAPHFETFPPDGLVLEVPVRYEQETLNRLAHLTGPDARIGGGSTRTVAILAARLQPGTVIPYGKEEQFLSPLPVEALSLWLELDPQLLATLSNWGVRTLGRLASLPMTSLVSRLGRKGEMLRKLARGEDAFWLAAHQREPEFIETQELEWTLNLLEPLVFLLGGMLNKLCSRLQERGLAAESLRIALKLSDHSVFEHQLKLAFPMRDPKTILSLLRLELQEDPPAAGVEGITLQALPAPPRIFQHSLLQPAAPHPEKLARTLTRLKSIFGEDRVGSPRLLDTHRPDAVVLEDLQVDRRRRNGRQGEANPVPGTSGRNRLALRRIRPPQPTLLRNEEILSCAGPWRSSGDWWGEEGDPAWSRDEWDIEMKDGTIYRIYWDFRSRQWFMEGIYD